MGSLHLNRALSHVHMVSWVSAAHVKFNGHASPSWPHAWPFVSLSVAGHADATCFCGGSDGTSPVVD